MAAYVNTMAKGRVRLKFMSGYRGVTIAKGLTDKELLVFGIAQKVTKVTSLSGLIGLKSGLSWSLYDAPASGLQR